MCKSDVTIQKGLRFTVTAANGPREFIVVRPHIGIRREDQQDDVFYLEIATNDVFSDTRENFEKFQRQGVWPNFEDIRPGPVEVYDPDDDEDDDV